MMITADYGTIFTTQEANDPPRRSKRIAENKSKAEEIKVKAKKMSDKATVERNTVKTKTDKLSVETQMANSND